MVGARPIYPMIGGGGMEYFSMRGIVVSEEQWEGVASFRQNFQDFEDLTA